MKHLLAAYGILLMLGGCKKVKENLQEEVALSLLDGTEWKVTSYMQGNVDRSADFSLYRFRFNRNRTIDALRNNSLEATGDFDGDIPEKTIYAHFSNAGPPLALLNATWTITTSTSKSLSANTTIINESRQLTMEKQ